MIVSRGVNITDTPKFEKYAFNNIVDHKESKVISFSPCILSMGLQTPSSPVKGHIFETPSGTAKSARHHRGR